MKRLSSVRIDRGTFLGLGSFEFMTFMRRGVFYTFMIYYLYDLLGKVTIVALLGTLTAFASIMGQNFLWGRIADRKKWRTQLIVTGEITAAVAYVIVYLSHKTLLDFGMGEAAGLLIIGGLSILEFFWSMSDVGWATLVTDITTPEIRGIFIGVINFISSVGRMTGVLFAGFLYEGGLGFRNGAIFYVVTGMLFAGAAIMVVSSRMIKSNRRKLRVPEPAPQDSPQDSTKIFVEKAGDSNRFMWFLISLVVIILGVASINQVFLLFLKLPQGLNATDEQVSLIVTAYTLGGMTASLLSGRLSDKSGRLQTIAAGLLLSILTLLLYGLAPNVELMALVYGVNGVAFMTLQTVTFAFAGDIIPVHNRARRLSLYNAVMALSWGPAGFFIGGPLADYQTGLGISPHLAYINVFIVAAILVSVGSVIFLTRVKRPFHERIRDSR